MKTPLFRIDPRDCDHPRHALEYKCEWPEAESVPSMHTCTRCGTSLQLEAPIRGERRLLNDKNASGVS